MKRILALLLALLLALGMAGAMAEDEGEGGSGGSAAPQFVDKDGQADYSGLRDQSMVFTKNYTTVGESPAIEFTFTAPVLVRFDDNNGGVVSGDGLDDLAHAPTLTLDSAASYDKGAYTAEDGRRNVTINVGGVTDETHVGVYKFSFNEVNSRVAGVTYDDSTHYIYVTVMRDEDDHKYYVVTMHNADSQNSASKVNFIANAFASGTLRVVKQVTGNMADTHKYFRFTVAMTAPDGTTIDHGGIDVSVDGARLAKTEGTGTTDYSDIDEGEGYRRDGDTYTFYLKHGQTIAFENVPEGVTYAVEEDEDGYTKTRSAQTSKDGDADGAIERGETETVTFVNEKVADVDTGVRLDSLPYVLLLAAAALGAALLLARRRRRGGD